jgi:ketosteroid isomerase-like protein
MSAAERDAFLAEVLDRQIEAEIALHNGDALPWRSLWSRRDPVTVAGPAVPFSIGWAEASATFDWVASLFRSSDDLDVEVLAAEVSGDLAYTVGIERYRASTTKGMEVDTTLRVTHVYRREDDGWRIVHRHGDHMPA